MKIKITKDSVIAILCNKLENQLKKESKNFLRYDLRRLVPRKKMTLAQRFFRDNFFYNHFPKSKDFLWEEYSIDEHKKIASEYTGLSDVEYSDSYEVITLKIKLKAALFAEKNSKTQEFEIDTKDFYLEDFVEKEKIWFDEDINSILGKSYIITEDSWKYIEDLVNKFKNGYDLTL